MAKLKPNYQKEIELHESNLRTGRLTLVRKRIQRVEKQLIPYKFVSAFAEIARRVEMPELGLELISPYLNTDSLDSEMEAEYCFCLKEIGAIEESQRRLSQLNSTHHKALLCQMHLAFNRWDFDRVIHAAESYLGIYDNETYQAAVVKTNLAAALVAVQKLDRARSLLNELISDCILNDWIRLQGNAHEIYAQVDLQQRNFNKVRLHVERARKICLGQRVKDQFFIDRWDAVLQAESTGNTEKLEVLKRMAVRENRFEMSRALDYELLRFRFNQPAYDLLYFGTPYKAYRKMLEEKFGPASERYTLNPEGQYQLILSEGTCNGQKICKPGGKLHNLLCSLLRDFYRPVRTGSIFDYVFPEDFMDPEYSFKRVYQLMYRSRQWLAELELPLSIESSNSEYKLIIPESVGITIERDNLISYRDLMLEKLARKFSNASFTSKQAEKELQISLASINRILKAGLVEKKLVRVRRGRQVAYTINVNSQK